MSLSSHDHVDNFHGARRYGTIKVQIKQAQSQARKRVVAFIVVFILSGFFSKSVTSHRIIIQLYSNFVRVRLPIVLCAYCVCVRASQIELVVLYIIIVYCMNVLLPFQGMQQCNDNYILLYKLTLHKIQ